MSKEVAISQNNAVGEWNPQQLDLLKSTICKGATNDEFQLFVQACRKTGLDPFSRQIHAVKRWDSSLKREAMTIQTGIDGYRLIADRSGCYAPGQEPSYAQDKDGKLVSATAYVKKMTKDGTWHEVSATAFYDEYVQTTKEGNPTSFWRKMPRGQLGKCAEALALRKAFPAELSGIYTHEEMQQADVEVVPAAPEPVLTEEEIQEFYTNFNGDKIATEAYVTMCAQKKRWTISKAISELQKDIAASHKAYKIWASKQAKPEPVTIEASVEEVS